MKHSTSTRPSSDDLSMSGLTLHGPGRQQGGVSGQDGTSSRTSSRASKKSHRSGASNTAGRGLATGRTSNKGEPSNPSNSAEDPDNDMLHATKKLREARKSLSRPGSSKASKQSSGSNINSKSAYFQGAYPDKSAESSTHSESPVPSAIFTPAKFAKGQSTSNKKYQLFIAPESSEALEPFCRTPMNGGTTFCIDLNCQVNHRGTEDLIHIEPGTVFIKASKHRAFLSPTSNIQCWKEELYVAWLDSMATMEEWIHRFRIIEILEDQNTNVKIDLQMISEESKSVLDLTNLQSVRKRKRPSGVKLEHIEYTLGCNFGEPPEDGFSIEALASAIGIMDGTIHNLINNVSLIHRDHVDLENFVKPSLHQGEEEFKSISTRIGNKPSYLTSIFDSPSLWTTLGLLSSEVVNISNQFNFEMSKFQKKTKELISDGIQSSNDPQFESIHSRLNNLKSTILSLVETVQELVEESEVNKNVKSGHHLSSARDRSRASLPSSNEERDSEGEEEEESLLSSSESSEDSLVSSLKEGRFQSLIRKTARAPSGREPPRLRSVSSHKELEPSRLDRLEADIRALKALKDGVAVKFCALGFKSRKDSDHWLKDHAIGSNFGLVVDVHTVFEHLYALIFGKESALTNLHSLARIRLQTDIEGIAVSSFEQQIPKLFTKSAFKVIRNDGSYFDTIPNYSDWSLTDDGYRDTVLEALQQFKDDHATLIDQELDISSPLHTVAFTSLQSSISWIEEFLRYMDTTYKEYTESKFNPKKAWHITTRLAKTLLTTIGEPRSGVVRAFKTKKPKSMQRLIFYATVQSLDRIEQTSHGGLKNSPVVANELVKFLAKNTNVEAIDRLEMEMKDLRQENARFYKLVQEGNAKAVESLKVANGANNKSDAATKNLTTPEKRVKKLED